MSGDKEQEYFSDGLAEEIINALTKIPGLKVIARTSSFAFRGREQDITKIAEALRVNTILEGSVRKSGDRIRVTAQLIAAADGSHLWSERYDRDMADAFVIQDEISQAIAERLRLSLAGIRPFGARRTQNMEAYNLYLKARFHLSNFTPESTRKGKEYFEQAVAVDPSYAQPWYGLAGLSLAMGSSGKIPPKTAYMESRRNLLQALALDEMLPEAHSLYGALLVCEYDWKGAEREFGRALELGPEVSDVWNLYGVHYLMPMRRFDEAITATRKAVELNPLSPLLHMSLGARYFFVQQYAQVIEHCSNALELNSNFALAHLWIGFARIRLGEIHDGMRAIETGIELLGRSPLYLGILGHVYALAGRTEEARKFLEQLQTIGPNEYVPAIAFGIIYFGLGEMEKGFDWLEKAVEEQDLFHIFHFGFLFDPIRPHPRYHALLRKMNLEP
jgi:TolB-like protein/Flp pilus assembly protein TadD